MDERSAGDLPLVSVIIPHYRDLTALNTCLASLVRQSYPADRFEIIVADNGSDEGPKAIEAVIAGRAKFVVVPERGAGPARNGAVRLAKGEILAFTDCDCIAESDWISEGRWRRWRGATWWAAEVTVLVGERKEGAASGRGVRARLRLRQRALRDGDGLHRHREPVLREIPCSRRSGASGSASPKTWSGPHRARAAKATA